MESGVLGKREREEEEAVAVEEAPEASVVKKPDEFQGEILVDETDDAAAPASMEVDTVISDETVLVEVALPLFVELPAVQESVVAEEADNRVEEVKVGADLERETDGIAEADVMQEEMVEEETQVTKKELKAVNVEGKGNGEEVNLEVEAAKEEVKVVNGEGEQEKELKVVTDEKQEQVQLGPKAFQSGVEMFTFFFELLNAWVANVDVNKYEYMVLSDLISKGHRDAGSKIGPGIKSFRVQFHPGWHSKCFYLLRVDGTVDDFSYRKCVEKTMPLPESLFSTSGDGIVERLFGPQENRWAKKAKVRGGFEGGGGGRGKHRSPQ